MLISSVYDFLLELRINNNKEWFQENKEKYNKAKKDFELFIEICIETIKDIDPEIAGIKAKDCIFRIFRDTRFSHNKDPYKTNFGALIAKNGRKSQYGGYYIHIEPDMCFIGGGCYMPESKILKAIREEIYHHTDDFISIIENKNFRKHYKELHGESLKTAPRGFDKHFEHINLLNHKHFAVVKNVNHKKVLSDGFITEIKESFTALHPLNQFLNNIINDL